MKCRQCFIQPFHGVVCRVLRGGFIFVYTRRQTGAGNFFPRFFIGQRTVFMDPDAHCFLPFGQRIGLVFFAAQTLIGLGVSHLFDCAVKIRSPCLPGRIHRLKAFSDLNHRVNRIAQGLLDQGFDIFQQHLGCGTDGQQLGYDFFGLRIKTAAPVVTGGFFQQLPVAGGQVQIKEAAAVECVLTDHLSTPGMNGVNRGLIHPLRRMIQALGASQPLAGIVRTSQGMQIVIPPAISAEKSRSLGQAVADTVPQFLCSGIGEGNDQNFRRRQSPKKAAFTAMSQYQPEIKGRDRVGLAGTCTGLDQTNAVQGKCQRIQYIDHAYLLIPICVI